MAALILLPFYLILCFFIALWLTKNKEFPFDWAFFYVFFCTPIIGAPIVVLAKQNPKIEVDNKKLKDNIRTTAIVFLVLGAITLYSFIHEMQTAWLYSNTVWYTLDFTIVFFGSFLFNVNKYRKVIGKNEISLIDYVAYSLFVCFLLCFVYGYYRVLF